MMEAKQLIEMNNRRRTELTPENEKYYSDFLIYIRLQFFLSEQQSEEILMEILDHIIEGQKEGKTALEIFGNDPKAFADELIAQIPKENKRNLARFISSLSLNMLGYLLMIRGAIIYIISFFKDVDITVYPAKSVLLFFIILGVSLFSAWAIFKIIGGSLFLEKKNSAADTVKAAVVGMTAFGVIFSSSHFLPNVGPNFDFSWYFSLVIGFLVWGASRFLKNW
ncbi:DUF1129 domain-containing protein [Neobacillus niacini]|uniref:DUF1129 domain-containing protein n=1 Tax=Neobacillus niacini TaxID=86668 RepID=UPI0021CB38BF|nr:DUF1129 domain-containing protein [Neobacillus niacini]MCM3765196.1 DUF1129 domain-containing protein [Neobacillus niacini]